MTEFAIILALVFMVFCLAFVIFHSVRFGRVTLLDWAFIGMAGVYGGGWALVAYVTQEGGNQAWSKWLLPFDILYPLHTLCALILASFMIFGWLLIGARLHPVKREDRPGFPNSSETRIAAVMWLLLFTAILVQWIYTKAYGGFFGLLKYSALIRSSAMHLVPANSLSFLQPFGGLALFASFGFFGLWLGRPRRLGMFIGLVISILFSLYILLSWLGRLNFLIYLVTFILGVLLYSRSRPLTLLLMGSISMLVILVGAYFVSVWLGIKAADNLYVFLARELSFPFGSFFAQLDLGENLFRGFLDFLVSPIYLLPSSWRLGWVEGVNQVNTALIHGAAKGVHGVSSGVPVDLLTLGLMQASVLGVAVVGIIFGILLRLCQHLLDQLPHAGVRAVFESYVALKVAVLGVFYAQPELVVSGNFTLLVTMVLLIVFLKKWKLLPVGCTRRHTRLTYNPSESCISSERSQN